MLRDRLQDDVSIVALSGELGTGTRSLQLGFRRHRGTTPQEFLAACRLPPAACRLPPAACRLPPGSGA
jgi:transcriptional regulator GlxA family with amidase domain